MRIESFKNYKTVHTWTGIIAGLMLYIAFVAGAMTMFKTALNQWSIERRNDLPAIAWEQYDNLIAQVLVKHPDAAKTMTVLLPASYPQHAPLTWRVKDKDSGEISWWHASLDDGGELITQSITLSRVGRFMDVLHRTAAIPGTLGRDRIGTLILGVISGLYAVALISGLIIFLPTWFKDFMSLRKGKNRKRYWLDFHNALGVTSLPFHLMIAWTAFAFALHGPIYSAMQSWVYGENPMFERPTPQKQQPYSSLASLDTINSIVTKRVSNFEITQLFYRNLNGKAPSLRVGGYVHGELVRGPDYNYTLNDPYTGEIKTAAFLREDGNGYGRFVTSLFALHMGNYGGAFVRWVYFAFGISGALVFLTGNILWLQSRQKKQPGTKQTRSYNNMLRLTIGVSLGTTAGISAVLLAAKCLPHQQLDISYWQHVVYYIVFLGALIWSFVRPAMRACKELLLANTALAVLVAAVSLLFSAYHGVTVAIFALLFAATFLLVYRRVNTVQSTVSSSDMETVGANPAKA
ncbi:MAG: hypothetical protein CSA53_03590 [Gammaproteobacteria bacterium]|nr:MAG: hypothetical protein CSA53_03590 [Gammaproteobacteria bacterium]